MSREGASVEGGGFRQVLAEEEAGRRQERVRMLEEANGVALEECTRRDAEARELMEQVRCAQTRPPTP